MVLTLQQRTGVLSAAASLAVILVLTLQPNYDPPETTSITCLVCGELGGIDVVLNVLLFVPFAVGLALAGLSWRWVVAIGAATTLLIEVLQLTTVYGRDASLSDVLTNTTGAAVGAALAPHWRTFLIPEARAARRLMIVASVAWIAMQLASAAMLRPDLPETAYYGQWQAELGQFDRFRGVLHEASLNGERLPTGRFPDTPRARRSMLETGIAVQARITTGTLTDRLAPIVSVFDDQQTEVVVLGQDRHDLVFRIRLKPSGFRFRSPGIRLPNVFTGAEGDTVEIMARFFGNGFQLTAGNRSVVVPESASWGWSFVSPWFHGFGPGFDPFSFLWLSTLFVPLGFWSTRAVDRAGPSAVAWLLVAAVGLAAIPLFLGVAASAWWEWLATFVGFAAGGATSCIARQAGRS